MRCSRYDQFWCIDGLSDIFVDDASIFRLRVGSGRGRHVRVVPETIADTPKIRAVVDWLDEVGATSRFMTEPGR